MKDKKLVIAVLIIIVLALVLIYVLAVKPKVQGYVINKQIEAQKSAVDTIIQIVNQQGYVVLGPENNSIILVKYQQPAQQPAQQLAQV